MIIVNILVTLYLKHLILKSCFVPSVHSYSFLLLTKGSMRHLQDLEWLKISDLLNWLPGHINRGISLEGRKNK